MVVEGAREGPYTPSDLTTSTIYRAQEVSVDEIFIAVKMMKVEGYINPRNGEEIPELNVDLVKEHLDFLEKMQFVKSNASRTKYEFTAELYRLFFRTDKKLHLFEERRIQ